MTKDLKERVDKALKIYNEYESSPTQTGMKFVVWHELKDNAVEMGGIIKELTEREATLEARIKELEAIVYDYEDRERELEFQQSRL